MCFYFLVFIFFIMIAVAVIFSCFFGAVSDLLAL